MKQLFWINGVWVSIEPKCSTCAWLSRFNKRPDEPSDMGCSKPGWEGYTFEDRPACGGDFYLPKSNGK